jgi:hypothetical protein
MFFGKFVVYSYVKCLSCRENLLMKFINVTFSAQCNLKKIVQIKYLLNVNRIINNYFLSTNFNNNDTDSMLSLRLDSISNA